MKNLIEVLSHLITFQTHEGNPHKKEEVKKLYDYFLSLIPPRYKYRRYMSRGHESLLVYTRSLTHPRIVLQAHADVVSAQTSLFSPRISGNKLVGRGVSDMKYAIACYALLLNELNHDMDIAVWLTSDEEIGGFDGVGYLLNQKKLSCDFCFLPDGGDNFGIVTQAKGVLHCALKSHGISAHGSTPWNGHNAIDILIDAYNELRKSPLFQKKDNWHNTINFGKIEGGGVVNKVADSAVGYFDIRFISQKDHVEIKKLLSKVIEDHKLSYTEIIKGQPYALDHINPFVVDFLQTLDHLHIPYTQTRDNGSSDARFFVEKNIPVLLCKPIGGSIHTNEEWIDIPSLEKYYKVLKVFVTL